LIEPLLALVFGLLIGSFLNVCIHRLPRGRSIVKPRSHCVRCRKTIAWYDNIPVVSYFVLGGKCRYCGRAISLRYPAVELLTGLLYFYFVATLGATAAALKMCVLSSLLVALIFTDLEKLLLPDQLTLSGTLAGLAFAAFVPVPDITAQAFLWLAGASVSGRLQWLTEAAMGAAVPALFLYSGGWIFYKVRHKEGLGLGDVKLIAMVGSFLGMRGALFTLIAGSVAGTIIGYAYIKATGRDPGEYHLPFGTFLGAGALAAAIGAERLTSWMYGM
jgi:leader peptidase (prepilin peptidase)/N-methyltransferase